MIKSFQLFTNLNYYSELLAGGWKKIFLIFLSWVAIISLISGSIFAFKTKSKLLNFLQSSSDQIIAALPPDFSLSWDGAKFQHHPSSPDLLKLDWPMPLQPTTEMPKYLVLYQALESSVPSNLENQNQTSALFFVNPAKFWVGSSVTQTWSEPVTWQSLPQFQSLPPQTWQRPDLIQLIGQTHQSLRLGIQASLIVYPLLTVFIGWWSNLWFCLFEASFIWILNQIFRWKTPWQQIFKLSLIIIPAALTMQSIGDWLYPNLSWSFFHLTYWLIFVLVNLRLPNLIPNSQLKEKT